MFSVKFECSLAHTSPPFPKSGSCRHFISLMSGNLLNFSLTWGSDLLLPAAYQVSIWTSFLGISRSSSYIFVAPFKGAVTTIRSITVTSLSFSSVV